MRFLADVYPYCCRYVKNENVAFFIACQFALESAFGTSSLAEEAHNISGMKMPSVRHSLACGQYGLFASYPSWRFCVDDFFLRNAYFRFTDVSYSSIGLYTRELARSKYCPEPDYVDKIMSIFEQYCDLFIKRFNEVVNDNLDETY